MQLSFTLHVFFVFALVLLTGCGGSSTADSKLEPPPEAVIDGGESSTAPELVVEFQATPPTATTDYFAKFTYSASGAASYLCSLDNNEFTTCEASSFYLSVGNGEHQFEVVAMASDGTQGEPAIFNWQVNELTLNQHEDFVQTNVSPSLAEPNSWRGIIRINCDFAHSSYNDPIVFPGQENAAHLHRFYGNTLVDHTTKAESLYTSGESSCQGNLLNRSAYWVPALLAPLYDVTNGARVLDANNEPAWQTVPAVVGNDDEAHEVFYYSAGVDDLASIQPVPAGLRMIAGNHATMPGQTQDTSIVRWHCQSWASDDATNARFSSTIPECLAPDRVRMDIFFPSCWDGVNLDSADHKSHMAYPVNEGGPTGTHCPESHPVAIVRPSYHYAFGVKPEVYDPVKQSSYGWRFASDMYAVTADVAGGLSLHGDWFNGWHPDVMEMLLEGCIQQGLDCHDGNLANGYRLSGTRAGTQIEAPIVNEGMGY